MDACRSRIVCALPAIRNHIPSQPIGRPLETPASSRCLGSGPQSIGNPALLLIHHTHHTHTHKQHLYTHPRTRPSRCVPLACLSLVAKFLGVFIPGTPALGRVRPGGRVSKASSSCTTQPTSKPLPKPSKFRMRLQVSSNEPMHPFLRASYDDHRLGTNANMFLSPRTSVQGNILATLILNSVYCLSTAPGDSPHPPPQITDISTTKPSGFLCWRRQPTPNVSLYYILPIVLPWRCPKQKKKKKTIRIVRGRDKTTRAGRNE